MGFLKPEISAFLATSFQRVGRKVKHSKLCWIGMSNVKILFDFLKIIIKLLSSFLAVPVHSIWYARVNTD